MAEMVGSAFVQEAVSRGVSLLLGKREEKASQAHMMERLEMAVNNLEHALERSAKLPITDVSLLQTRKNIKCAYAEALEVLDRHKQQAVPSDHGQMVQGLNSKRWTICSNNVITSLAILKTDDVRRYEWFADCAGKFLRDVESGCSLRHYTFCNPIIRRLLEGKTLRYASKQGNRLRSLDIWPTSSEERGAEALLCYKYEDTTMAEKWFHLLLSVRLSESTDIVLVATKGLQALTSRFKLAAKSALGEMTKLPSLLQDISYSHVPALAGIQVLTEICRRDPACCRASRHGVCGNSIVSSELQHIFSEEVIYFGFSCYISALEPRSWSLSDEVCRRASRGWTSPLVVSAGFMPHFLSNWRRDSYADIMIEKSNRERRDIASVQQAAEALKSEAINCFSRQPELTDYRIYWYSKHGGAWFQVEKPRMERTKRRYNTRGSTKQSTSRR